MIRRMSVRRFQAKPNANSRVLSGHPWVFANEVEAPLPPECDGEVVECRDRTGRLLGTGICNGRSQIVWRRLSRERVVLDAAYPAARWSGRSRARGARAVPAPRLVGVGRSAGRRGGPVWRRAGGPDPDAGDGEALGARSATCFAELLQPAEIIFRNDAPIRRLEGLPLETHTRSGRALGAALGRHRRFRLLARPHGRARRPVFTSTSASSMRPWRSTAPGKRVLDAFCNQGPFALHAAKAGADRRARTRQRGGRHRGGPPQRRAQRGQGALRRRQRL